MENYSEALLHTDTGEREREREPMRRERETKRQREMSKREEEERKRGTERRRERGGQRVSTLFTSLVFSLSI